MTTQGVLIIALIVLVAYWRLHRSMREQHLSWATNDSIPATVRRYVSVVLPWHAPLIFIFGWAFGALAVLGFTAKPDWATYPARVLTIGVVLHAVWSVYTRHKAVTKQEAR